MITTTASNEYTLHALRSFFETTPFSEADRFFLVDNDGNYEIPVSLTPLLPPSFEVIRPSSSRSFAENVNDVRIRAIQNEHDLFFLNNDLIFTKEWIPPLLVQGNVILSPFSNREVQYETSGFQWGNVLSLDQYLARPHELLSISELHRNKNRGYKKVLTLPFFCIKLPIEILKQVGPLDESYGRGGAEDDDYCLRCYLGGFSVAYAAASYVLHFSGRSTWAGTETKEETDARCVKFRERFKSKWGERCYKIFMEHDMRELETDPTFKSLASKGDFTGLLQQLIVN